MPHTLCATFDVPAEKLLMALWVSLVGYWRASQASAACTFLYPCSGI